MPTFDDIGLEPSLRQNLQRMGYETPTPIQAAVVAPALAGKDVMGLARTGTGKTSAFGIPLVLWASGPYRLMFDLGREVEFLWQDGRTSCGQDGSGLGVCSYSQWDATFPLLTSNVARNGNGKFGQDVMVRLSGRLGNRSKPVGDFGGIEREFESPRQGAFAGVVLSIDTMNRFYLQ